MGATHGKGRFLLGFGLTDHFLLRQWERKILDQELLPVLLEMRDTAIVTGMVVVPLLTKDRFSNALFIKVKRKNLITCFVTSIADYMGKNRHDSFFLSHQKLRLSHLKK